MGRNSLDATNACLMRAVRAVRAALAARLTGFLARAPFFELTLGLAGFSTMASASVVFLARTPAFPIFLELGCALGLLSGSDAALALLSAFALFLLSALGLTVFLAFLARDEAESAVRGVWLLLVCPAIGDTTIKTQSRPATQRASTEAETGEIATLMLPL
jgi:hypothetical protein